MAHNQQTRTSRLTATISSNIDDPLFISDEPEQQITFTHVYEGGRDWVNVNGWSSQVMLYVWALVSE